MYVYVYCALVCMCMFMTCVYVYADDFTQTHTHTHTHTHTQASGVTIEEWPRDIARPDGGHQLIPYVLDRVRLELYGRFAEGM